MEEVLMKHIGFSKSIEILFERKSCFEEKNI